MLNEVELSRNEKKALAVFSKVYRNFTPENLSNLVKTNGSFYCLLDAQLISLRERLECEFCLTDFDSIFGSGNNLLAYLFISALYDKGENIDPALISSFQALDIFKPEDLILLSRIVQNKNLRDALSSQLVINFSTVDLIKASCIASLRGEYIWCARYIALIEASNEFEANKDDDILSKYVVHLRKYLRSKTASLANSSILTHELFLLGINVHG